VVAREGLTRVPLPQPGDVVVQHVVGASGKCSALFLRFKENHFGDTEDVTKMKSIVKQRHEISRNPSTPVDVLVQLGTDKNKYVRMCVAANPSTPVDVLRQLATDANRWVRWFVANNPRTPGDVLKQLAADEDRDVRDCAQDTLSCLLVNQNSASRP
jgi:hypothetical protein